MHQQISAFFGILWYLAYVFAVDFGLSYTPHKSDKPLPHGVNLAKHTATILHISFEYKIPREKFKVST